MKKDSRYYKLIQSRDWRELRARKLTANPLCEICLESGLYVSATEVHHKKPAETALTHAEMFNLMFSWDNLQSLCHECHQAEHRRLMSHSRDEIKRRNAARTQRFNERFLNNREGGIILMPPLPQATNPLPQITDKFSGSEKSVGGGVKQDEQ